MFRFLLYGNAIGHETPVPPNVSTWFKQHIKTRTYKEGSFISAAWLCFPALYPVGVRGDRRCMYVCMYVFFRLTLLCMFRRLFLYGNFLDHFIPVPPDVSTCCNKMKTNKYKEGSLISVAWWFFPTLYPVGVRSDHICMYVCMSPHVILLCIFRSHFLYGNTIGQHIFHKR